MALTKRERKERMRGEQGKLADELGISDSTVSAVMNGRTQLYSRLTVQKVRAAVAERLGKSIEEVWGTAA